MMPEIRSIQLPKLIRPSKRRESEKGTFEAFDLISQRLFQFSNP
jgi:hypothetical protein